jgi:hypothetical protein
MGSLESTCYTAAECSIHLWAATFGTCCNSHLVSYCVFQAWHSLPFASAFQVLHQRCLMHRFEDWFGPNIDVTRFPQTFELEDIEQVRSDIERAFEGG